MSTNTQAFAGHEMRELSENEVDHVSGGIAFLPIFAGITAGIGAASAAIDFYNKHRNWFNGAARDVGNWFGGAARSVGRFFSSIF